MAERGLELVDSIWIATQTVVDYPEFTMRKVVVEEVQTVGACAPLIALALLDGLLQIGDGVRPECSIGVGHPALVIIPPTATPDLARRHAVLSAIFDVDLPLLNGASHQAEE